MLPNVSAGACMPTLRRSDKNTPDSFRTVVCFANGSQEIFPLRLLLAQYLIPFKPMSPEQRPSWQQRSRVRTPALTPELDAPSSLFPTHEGAQLASDRGEDAAAATAAFASSALGAPSSLGGCSGSAFVVPAVVGGGASASFPAVGAFDAAATASS